MFVVNKSIEKEKKYNFSHKKTGTNGNKAGRKQDVFKYSMVFI